MKICLYESELKNKEPAFLGSAFLLGNGHLGYRGSYEEDGKEGMPALNIQGLYDRQGNKWRESINMPNPFFIRVLIDGKEVSVREGKPRRNERALHLDKAVLERATDFDDISVKSTRFVSNCRDNLLASSYSIKAKKDLSLLLDYGMDDNVFDINGPHFVSKDEIESTAGIIFRGRTNEGRVLFEGASYKANKGQQVYKGHGRYANSLSLKEGEEFVLETRALVFESETSVSNELQKANSLSFLSLRHEHELAFEAKWKSSLLEIEGPDKEANFALAYSIYELLIIGDRNRSRSIAARGLSGQTYKGAVFWDSEIFILPFFLLTDYKVAKGLIQYRINTLEGAKKKAKEFGYEGAFYAWESQDDGTEACSKFNVSDPVTGKPIRTYFNEKQIHISSDIPFAIDRYIKTTNDVSILEEGALDVLVECSLFFISYAKKEKDGLYHLNDVIGPDEYHERVDDDAFTNYMAKKALTIAIHYLRESKRGDKEELISRIGSFLSKLYLPSPNKDGVIEQFRGYFKKEDVSVATVRSRLKNPQDYWGGEFGVASPTQVIKQADVVAMLVLLGDEFPLSVKEANYRYYYPRTEHGSSLSASMYALLGCEIGELDTAYAFYKQSAEIDLVGASKCFAGGIYIGGSHPASNGGAYLSSVYGFAGLSLNDDGTYSFSPRLPSQIERMTIPYLERGYEKIALIDKMGVSIKDGGKEND